MTVVTAGSGASAAPAPPAAREARDLSLLARLSEVRGWDPNWSDLVDAAAEVWTRPGFDTYVSLPHLRFEPFPHQLAAARTALRAMRGRAILADEVGLGKTIEAGIVLSELRLRGLAERTLVVTPAGLVEQWVEEMDRKFGLPTTVLTTSRGAVSLPGDRSVVVASLAVARRDPALSLLAGEQWDLVIVDEAHRVRNPRTSSGALARALQSRFLLLLTATPVENRLDDVFHLVSLITPGLLGTPAEFRRRHGSGSAVAGSGSAGPAVADLPGLRGQLRQVMVRHRRGEVSVGLPPRLAETVRVGACPQEEDLYAQLAKRIRDDGRQAAPSRLLALRGLARLGGSSPAALSAGLAKAGWDDLAGAAAGVRSPRKTDVLLDLLRHRLPTDGKVVVFSGFRATVDHLKDALDGAGIAAEVYHGSLTRTGKERAVAAFRDEVPVLVTTEAAGEGRNLQFCHSMVNYDLPWNPMQIEQRLGRIHRIGQRHDVVLTNLAAAGTIEDHILRVLESKINMFELVVGELDMILGRVDDDFDFEARVFAEYLAADDDGDFSRRLDALGDQLAQAREAYLLGRSVNDDLVDPADEATKGSGS